MIATFHIICRSDSPSVVLFTKLSRQTFMIKTNSPLAIQMYLPGKVSCISHQGIIIMSSQGGHVVDYLTAVDSIIKGDRVHHNFGTCTLEGRAKLMEQ